MENVAKNRRIPMNNVYTHRSNICLYFNKLRTFIHTDETAIKYVGLSVI